MAEPRAYYFHSTVYSFNVKAVEAVVRNLHGAVQSVAVQCHYDRELDGFELSCPQQIGPIANDALHKVIVGYVEEEIKGAENAEREPNIQRFADSIVVADFDHPATIQDYAHDDENDANTGPPATTSNSATAQPAEVFLHSVCDEGSESTIKLFNLRDTGPDMLLRVLVDPGRELRHVAYTGFTCRAATWSPRDLFYAFNGRVGESIVSEGGDGLGRLFACDLVRLRGVVENDKQGDEKETIPTAQDPELKHWNFKGDKPTVKQFLEGMGETELVDPNTAPDASEMPSDARKYNAAPEHQTRLYGRSRRPATVEASSEEDDVDSSPPEDTEDADAGDEGSQASSGESDSSKNSMLMRLRNFGPQPAANGEESLVATDANEGAPSASTPRAGTSNLGSVPGTSNFHTGGFGGSAPARKLRNLGSSYARLDKNGLTGNAKLQAEWDHDVHMPPPRKLNKYGIARRPPTQLEDLSPEPTSNSSADMSLDTGPDVRAANLTPMPTSSFSAAPAPLEMLGGCSETEPEYQPWANRMQSSTVVMDDLVDVGISRSRAANGQVRPPSGFEASFGKWHATSSRSGPDFKSARSKDKGSHLNDLIGLDFAGPESAKPRLTPSGKYQPANPTFPLFAAMCNHQSAAQVAPPNDDDSIVERLQDTSHCKRPLRNTMRQKAAKKKKRTKGKKTASAQPKNELPLPSPPPPPKPKKVEKSFDIEASQHRSEAGGSTETNGSRRTTKTPNETEIEKLLAKVEHLHGMPGVELQVSFGMLMVRSKNESLRCGNFNASKLQSRLQAQQNAGDLMTDFFERLTASDMDAAYLFDLLPGEALEPKVEYEIGIRLLLGEDRTIKFDQNDRNAVEIFAPEQTAATLFMHYPIRVHDARSRVIKPQRATDVDPAHVASFLSSIRTLDSAPSFKALVPRTAFSVNYVRVNRIFTKEIVPGVQLRVVETQDLHLAPISNSANFNFLATSTSRAAMVDTHRQWYECSLHLAPVGGVMGEVLQSLIDQMVAEMDGVGFANRGPYWTTEREVEVVQKVNFW